MGKVREDKKFECKFCDNIFLTNNYRKINMKSEPIVKKPYIYFRYETDCPKCNHQVIEHELPDDIY